MLQPLQKPRGVPAVHLHMVELERDGQQRLGPAFAIFTPHHHRVEELVGVLIDDAVELGLDHRRGADDHVAVEEYALALRRHLGGQLHVVAVKLLQIFGIWDVARVDASLTVAHHHVDGDLVVLIQLSGLRQQCNSSVLLATLPMHQHISVLNFTPLFLLIFSRLPTFIVFTSVTIGIGAVIHISKANARLVSWGLICCFIFKDYSFSILGKRNCLTSSLIRSSVNFEGPVSVISSCSGVPLRMMYFNALPSMVASRW